MPLTGVNHRYHAIYIDVIKWRRMSNELLGDEGECEHRETFHDSVRRIQSWQNYGGD